MYDKTVQMFYGKYEHPKHKSKSRRRSIAFTKAKWINILSEMLITQTSIPHSERWVKFVCGHLLEIIEIIICHLLNWFFWYTIKICHHLLFVIPHEEVILTFELVNVSAVKLFRFWMPPRDVHDGVHDLVIRSITRGSLPRVDHVMRDAFVIVFAFVPNCSSLYFTRNRFFRNYGFNICKCLPADAFNIPPTPFHRSAQEKRARARALCTLRARQMCQ